MIMEMRTSEVYVDVYECRYLVVVGAGKRRVHGVREVRVKEGSTGRGARMRMWGGVDTNQETRNIELWRTTAIMMVGVGGSANTLRSARLRLNLLLTFLVTPRVLVSKFTFNVHILPRHHYRPSISLILILT